MNYQIRIPEVFLIDEKGNQVGVIETKQAILKAQDIGLDLVEVSPLANPPVCKIADFGNFQYKQSKKKQTARQKKVELKGIRLSFKIGAHDIAFRKKQAEKFLKQGDKVKIELNLRGREKAHKDLAKEKINNFIENIKIEKEIEQPLKAQGSRLSITIKAKK